MTNHATIKELENLLADTYALYLKTQNYHWHVKGPYFSQLHEFFEEQYKSLAEHVDEVAERIVMLGAHAPASFKALMALTNINDGDSALTWQNMVSDLASDHDKLIAKLQDVSKAASSENDEVTLSLVSDHLGYYEKQRWMLENHIN